MTQAAILAASGSPGTTTGFKNRIINGAMTIDQRNAGASWSATNGGYSLDRWQTNSYTGGGTTGKFTVQQNAGSVTPPVGFTNYLGITASASTSTSASDIYTCTQIIEGYNVADLGWGTANAKTITISFWVRSSLTGTFGCLLRNDAGNRNYAFTYTISSANTWEQKSVTVAGCTDGAWLTTNGGGLYVFFGIQVGTNFTIPASSTWNTSTSIYGVTGCVNVLNTSGNTLYITGVQLEVGTTATNFDFRSIGTELALCQRYYEKSYDMSSVAGATTTTGCMSSSRQNGQYGNQIQFRVSKRATPTVTVYSTSSGQSGYIFNDNQSNSLVATTIRVGENAFVTGAGSSALGEAQAFHYTASAEL